MPMRVPHCIERPSEPVFTEPPKVNFSHTTDPWCTPHPLPPSKGSRSIPDLGWSGWHAWFDQGPAGVVKVCSAKGKAIPGPGKVQNESGSGLPSVCGQSTS
mmetsp:Transcript_29887/g.53778  ORF Transcript_29887/g.53778 Transcript_29887/m.53778 type:complete len:101 (-) Transcript_29887:131-433(-)